MKNTRKSRKVIALIMAIIMALAMLPFGAMFASAAGHNGDVSSADPKNLALVIHEAALVQVQLFAKSRYTPWTYKELQDRFNEACYLLHEERSVQTGEPATQEDVDNMIAALQGALDNLTEMISVGAVPPSVAIAGRNILKALDKVLGWYYDLAAGVLTEWTAHYRTGEDGKYWVSP
jgi:hypothetical protein